LSGFLIFGGMWVVEPDKGVFALTSEVKVR